jgi:hypothetical protein
MFYIFKNLSKKYFISLFIIFSLTSCASITTGPNQSLSVNTGSITGAKCSLSNNKGTWYINDTPGTVTVHRSFDDIVVKCTKDEKTNTIKVKSNAKGMTFGNIITGGIIGAGVDAANGSGYDYPTLIHVPL